MTCGWFSQITSHMQKLQIEIYWPWAAPSMIPGKSNSWMLAPLYCKTKFKHKVSATILLMHPVTSQCVVHYASASCTAAWLVTTEPSCPVVRLCMITQICEWKGPAYSANLLAQVYDALKERWLLLKYHIYSTSPEALIFFSFFFLPVFWHKGSKESSKIDV